MPSLYSFSISAIHTVAVLPPQIVTWHVEHYINLVEIGSWYTGYTF